MGLERYNARAAEIHWQQVWEARNVFAASNDDPRPEFRLDVAGRLRPGRHGLDHVRNGTIVDVIARYQRANGFRVVYASGFGLLAEHAAPDMGQRAGSEADNIAAAKITQAHRAVAGSNARDRRLRFRIRTAPRPGRQF